jgi:ribonuclease P protein component
VGRKLETLKVRADFLRVARAGRRSAAPGLVVQAAPHPRQPSGAAAIRVGFTASRKVGNAVVRNRAKRRMRAAAASVLPALGQPGTDYVLIARAGTADRPFADLIADLEAALRRIGRGGAPRPSGAGPALLSHEAPGQAHHARHQPRPQQPRIIAGEAPHVLTQTNVDDRGGGDITAADRPAPGEDEIIALANAFRLSPIVTIETSGEPDPLPDEECPDRNDLGCEKNALT